jgi:hypothetical protein
MTYNCSSAKVLLYFLLVIMIQFVVEGTNADTRRDPFRVPRGINKLRGGNKGIHRRFVDFFRRGVFVGMNTDEFLRVTHLFR